MVSIIGQTALSNLARDVAELKQRNADRLVPVEVVVETVTPLVLTLPDGETMEGAIPLGAQLEAGKAATLLIGEGRAWVWRQVDEAELQPGEMASEHLAALEQLKFESDRAENRALEARTAAAEVARLAQEAQDEADSRIEDIEDRFEGVTAPLHEIEQQAGQALAGLAETAKTITAEYAEGTSATIPPVSGWSEDIPAAAPGVYVWLRFRVVRADDSVTYTTPAMTTGHQGAPGPKGDDGTSVTITGRVPTAAQLPTGLGPDDAGKGWITEDDGHLHVWSGTGFTDVGQVRGHDGSDGRSIVGQQVAYQSSSSGDVIPTGTWVSSPPTVPQGWFLWTRVTLTFDQPPLSSAHYSVARFGIDGAAGDDGRSIVSTEVHYALSASGTVAPTTGWAETPQLQTVAQPYLWTRTTQVFNWGADAVSYAVSRRGDKGDTGTGVSSITPHYRLLPTGSSQPATPSGAAPSGWSTTEPPYTPGQELWRSERLTLSDGTHVWTVPQLSSAYSAAVYVGNLNAEAIQGLVKVAADDPGHYPGRVWWQVDDDDHFIGLRHSDGSTWQSYVLAADQVIAANSITAPLIHASEELWAKLATFVEIRAGMIKAGALDFGEAQGFRLVSPLIETYDYPYRGIKLSGNDLIGYDANGLETFRVDGDSGDVSISGGLFADGDITGSTLTGNTIQTSSLQNRGIKIIGNLLQAWDAAGTRTFLLDGSNGDVTITGGTFTGGTIQTATSGARIRLTENRMYVHNEAGRSLIEVDPLYQPPGAIPKQPALVFREDSTTRPITTVYHRYGMQFFNPGGTTSGNVTSEDGSISITTYGSATSTSNVGIYNYATNGSVYVETWNGGRVEMSSPWFEWFVQGADAGLESWRMRPVLSGGRVAATWEFVAGRSNMLTFTDAANLAMNSSGFIGISSSSARFKDDITPGDWGDAILTIEPATWIDKASREMDPDYATRTPGVIAEDVDAAGLGDFVTYDAEGRPAQVSERLWTALIPVVRDLRDRINRLEESRGS